MTELANGSVIRPGDPGSNVSLKKSSFWVCFAVEFKSFMVSTQALFVYKHVY
jgi:hypothetical protein